MITHLYRYPIKGLSPETLETVRLEVGEGLAGDRVFAIARKPQNFDPTAPQAEPKTKFIMLMRDEALALLDTQLNGRTLTIRKAGAVLLKADIDTHTSEIEAFFKHYVEDAHLDPRWVSAPGHKFTDISVVSQEKMRAISLINLNSVKALEAAVGASVDPLRFRANIYFDDVPAWQEFDWIGRDIRVGAARARVVMRTQRCAATQVNPVTAARDLNVPKCLKQHFGHMDMGIYAEISESGGAQIGGSVSED